MYLKNLFLAFIAIFKSSSMIDFLLNIDRLGNALCAGYAKATVSARVGYFALTKKNPYWRILEWIINETFRPVDGTNHCFNAFVWESKRGLSHRRGSDIALGALSIVVVVACLILAPIIYIIALIKK